MRSPSALLLVLLLLVSACAAGGGGTSAEVPASGPQVAAAGSGPLDFTATTLAGEEISGGEFAGQDLMLWFWAPW